MRRWRGQVNGRETVRAAAARWHLTLWQWHISWWLHILSVTGTVNVGRQMVNADIELQFQYRSPATIEPCGIAAPRRRCAGLYGNLCSLILVHVYDRIVPVRCGDQHFQPRRRELYAAVAPHSALLQLVHVARVKLVRALLRWCWNIVLAIDQRTRVERYLHRDECEARDVHKQSHLYSTGGGGQSDRSAPKTRDATPGTPRH